MPSSTTELQYTGRHSLWKIYSGNVLTFAALGAGLSRLNFSCYRYSDEFIRQCLGVAIYCLKWLWFFCRLLFCAILYVVTWCWTCITCCAVAAAQCQWRQTLTMETTNFRPSHKFDLPNQSPKFVTGNYISEFYLITKFGTNTSTGDFWASRWNITNIFIIYTLLFIPTYPGCPGQQAVKWM